MDNVNEYLKGSQFTLYVNPTPAPELGTMQMKTWNHLKMAMSEHKFFTQNRQQANLLGHLKNRQQNHADIQHINNLHFTVYVDIFPDSPGTDPSILTMTDESTAYSISTVVLS
jgi:hypothetical protein